MKGAHQLLAVRERAWVRVRAVPAARDALAVLAEGDSRASSVPCLLDLDNVLDSH